MWLISICSSNYYVEIMHKSYVFHFLQKLFIIIYKAFRILFFFQGEYLDESKKGTLSIFSL